jgi:hypothetical protein
MHVTPTPINRGLHVRESVGLTRCLLDIRLPLGDVFHDLLDLLLVIGMVEYS